MFRQYLHLSGQPMNVTKVVIPAPSVPIHSLLMPKTGAFTFVVSSEYRIGFTYSLSIPSEKLFLTCVQSPDPNSKFSP